MILCARASTSAGCAFRPCGESHVTPSTATIAHCTGSFFATSLVSLRGLGLIRATAHTKAFNFASNIGSLLVFLAGGHAIILLGLCMAIGSASGAYAGSHTAMRFGAKVIRPVLATVSLALTIKLLWTALSGG